jgi:hypothetical protein
MSESIQWWKPGHVVEQATCNLADIWDAIFGRQELFAQVDYGGNWCTIELHEVESFTRTECKVEECSSYEITMVRMTRRQFERLPEFGGW